MKTKKPDNSTHGDCKECTSYFGYPMSKCFHCKPKVSEPSESQEEILGPVKTKSLIEKTYERGKKDGWNESLDAVRSAIDKYIEFGFIDMTLIEFLAELQKLRK